MTVPDNSGHTIAVMALLAALGATDTEIVDTIHAHVGWRLGDTPADILTTAHGWLNDTRDKHAVNPPGAR